MWLRYIITAGRASARNFSTAPLIFFFRNAKLNANRRNAQETRGATGYSTRARTGAVVSAKVSTNTANHSPSWEAASGRGTQNVPSMLHYPMLHCRVHKSPGHTLPVHASKIHFNIIPLCLVFRVVSFSDVLANTVYVLLSHPCYVSCPSNPPFDNNNIWGGSSLYSFLHPPEIGA
jgi:hypothetical protein